MSKLLVFKFLLLMFTVHPNIYNCYQLIPAVVVLRWERVPVLEHRGLWRPCANKVSVLYDMSSLCCDNRSDPESRPFPPLWLLLRLVGSKVSLSMLALEVEGSKGSFVGRVARSSIRSPAAAMRGTARQQSKSWVRVSLICRIRSRGFKRPEVSAGPPFRIRLTKIPFS